MALQPGGSGRTPTRRTLTREYLCKYCLPQNEEANWGCSNRLSFLFKPPKPKPSIPRLPFDDDVRFQSIRWCGLARLPDLRQARSPLPTEAANNARNGPTWLLSKAAVAEVADVFSPQGSAAAATAATFGNTRLFNASTAAVTHAATHAATSVASHITVRGLTRVSK